MRPISVSDAWSDWDAHFECLPVELCGFQSQSRQANATKIGKSMILRYFCCVYFTTHRTFWKSGMRRTALWRLQGRAFKTLRRYEFFLAQRQIGTANFVSSIFSSNFVHSTKTQNPAPIIADGFFHTGAHGDVKIHRAMTSRSSFRSFASTRGSETWRKIASSITVPYFCGVYFTTHRSNYQWF